jgi:3-isopropylmalate/(R)-2-methylmalate dehydratase small subunit
LYDNPMTALTILTGPAAPLLIDNINTDLIAPMYRPAQAGTLRGLGANRADLAGMLFAGWRYDTQDREIPEFVLNRAPFRNARFLLAGANFGCGSSRDTAALMLSAFGIRCVAAPSFGEIFRDNCFKAGMLPLALERGGGHGTRAGRERRRRFHPRSRSANLAHAKRENNTR